MKCIRLTWLLLLLALREEVRAGKRKKLYYHPDMKLTMPALVARHGYPVETHNVTSSDGYIQTLHRIPRGKAEDDARRIPVLVHHALLCSSVDWIILGPDKALGYKLADAGYDVWLANGRGNTYSRGHISKTIRDPEYWEFSWHEIGAYDLPAAIDYILNITQHEKLFYIGYSMGSTAFFVMMSENPEYNHKVHAMIALGPVATFFTRPENNFIGIAHELGESTFRIAAKILGMHEVWPRKRWLSSLGMKICKKGMFTVVWCASVMEFLCGKSNQTDLSMLPIFYSHTPAGASSRQLLHFGQLIDSTVSKMWKRIFVIPVGQEKAGREHETLATGWGACAVGVHCVVTLCSQQLQEEKFRQYDFGVEKNMEIYGSPEPPEYNLNNTKVPVALFYSDNDSLSTAKNTEMLSEVLPNVIGRYRVPHDSFNHLDFMWGKDVNTLVYSSVIDVLRYLPLKEE